MSRQDSIVAAVDLDARAEGIVHHAARLASLTRAHLILLHVVSPPDPGTIAGGEALSQHADRVGFASDRQARAWLMGMACHLELPRFEILVCRGPLRPRILDVIREHHPRCLIAGPGLWGGYQGPEWKAQVDALGCRPVEAPEEEISEWLAQWQPRRL
jgi:nucleotide-binding universal stress UspA family protein